MTIADQLTLEHLEYFSRVLKKSEKLVRLKNSELEAALKEVDDMQVLRSALVLAGKDLRVKNLVKQEIARRESGA